MYDARIGEADYEPFPALPFPVSVGPDSPTRLMLLVTTDDAGRAKFARGRECLYVRHLELRLADGGTVTVGHAGDIEDPWFLAVPPDRLKKASDCKDGR